MTPPNDGMNPIPKISVLMPVYNAQRYLGEAVESILAQSFADFEFIAVDDGSKDDSRGILQTFADKDKRIQILSRSNTGIVGALNDGLALCRADWIARMDADDWAYPHRFERQLAFLKEHPDYLAAGTDYQLIDGDGDPLETRAYPHDPAAIENTLLGGLCCLQHPTVMMKREAVLAVGGYRREYQWVEDYDLFLRLSAQGPIANQPDTLLRYRVHEQSVCHQRGTEQVNLLRQAQLEAHRVRGLAALPEVQKPRVPPTLAELYWHWATLARRSGHVHTACKYARKYLRQVGLTPQSWRLLLDCDPAMRWPARLWHAAGRMGRHLPGLWRLWA